MAGDSRNSRRRVSIVTTISLLFLALALTNLAVTWIFSGANQMRLISEKAYLQGASLAAEILLHVRSLLHKNTQGRMATEPGSQTKHIADLLNSLRPHVPLMPAAYDIFTGDLTHVWSEPSNSLGKIAPSDAQNLLKALQIRDLHHQIFLGVPDLSSYSIRLYIPLASAGGNDLVLITRAVLKDIPSDLQSLTRLIVSTIFILLAIQVGIGLLLYRLLIRPLRLVSHAAVEIGDGKFISIAVPQRQNDEIAALVEAFNQMSAELKSKDAIIRDQVQDLAEKNATMDFELEIAERIQRSILPEVADWPEISVEYTPLHRVSGDFYDLAHFEDGSVGVLLADASGHGVPAAFLTILLKVLFTSLHTEIQDPGELMLAVNAQMCKYLGYSGFYLTAFYIKINPDGSALYCNCGHPPPWHISQDGKIADLSSSNSVIGLMEDLDGLEVRSVKFEKDDKLFLYTDGLSEQMNAQGVMIDTEMLRNHLLTNRTYNNLELINDLLRLSEEHRSGTGLKDDVTSLLFEPAELIAAPKQSTRATKKLQDTYLELLSRLLQLRKSSSLYVFLIVELLRKGDRKKGLELLAEAINQYPESKYLLRLRQKLEYSGALKGLR